jgi:hypothetical protein
MSVSTIQSTVIERKMFVSKGQTRAVADHSLWGSDKFDTIGLLAVSAQDVANEWGDWIEQSGQILDPAHPTPDHGGDDRICHLSDGESERR